VHNILGLGEGNAQSNISNVFGQNFDIFWQRDWDLCSVNLTNFSIFSVKFHQNFNIKKWKQKNSGHFQLIDQMDGLVQMIYYLVVSPICIVRLPCLWVGGGMRNIKSTILDVRFNVGGANFGYGWSLLLIECRFW
jgi:hypothetical protein